MTIIRWVDQNFERSLLVVLLTVMALSSFAQVVLRYAFDASLLWSEELSRYAFIWMTYVGLSHLIRHRGHVNIDVLQQISKGRLRLVFPLITDLAFLAFALMVLPSSIGITSALIDGGNVSAGLRVPSWVVHAALLVGLCLAAARSVQMLVLDGRALILNREPGTDRETLLPDGTPLP